MLSAVDKNDFAAYEEKYGPRDAKLREQIEGFLQIRSLAQLEAFVAGNASERVEARVSEWKKLLTGLEAMELGPFVAVDLGVVRGLAYYTGFVFEAFDRKGELRALAGGGRYDDLVQKLGGPALPAVGFAIGDVTTGLLLEQRGLMPNFVQAPDIYCVLGGEKERLVAFRDIQGLRAAGFRVDYPMKEIAFGKQFKAAAETGAKLALIYGGEEVARGVVKIRDLTQRTEHEVPRDQVAAHVRDFFSGA
jgi:histidyl-tRNA synthetase